MASEDDRPEAPEPCDKCNGAGSFWQKKEGGGSLSGSRTLCPKCLGTRVQP
jgi:DnaJ-class molecular chaperone